jgi:hypothetical protein
MAHPDDPIVFDRLTSLVEAFRATRRDPGLEDWFGDSSLPLEESIVRAVTGIGPFRRNGGMMLHWHQRRVGGEVLAEAAPKLRIQAGALATAANFDALFAIVDDAVGAIPRIGPLTVYDIAHRIGTRLGHAPERVYLHSGTSEGARALGISTRERAILLSSLPEPLHRLSPAQAEDFLCMHKKDIADIVAGRPFSGPEGTCGGARSGGCGPRSPRRSRC